MKLTDSMTREQRRYAIQQTRAYHAEFDRIYQETATGTPAETIEALIQSIGFHAAVETVAELVNNTSDWDARVPKSAHEWALDILGAADPVEVARYGYYHTIHPAHIGQLAEAMQDVCTPRLLLLYMAEHMSAEQVAVLKAAALEIKGQ